MDIPAPTHHILPVELQCSECVEPIKSRGLCNMHYMQAYRGGYLNDYPEDKMYQAEWAENAIQHILKIHGTDMLEEALLIHRLNAGTG